MQVSIKYKQAISTLKSKQTFSLIEARKVGISHTAIYRLVGRGNIVKLARGIYAIAGERLAVGESADFTIACKKFRSQSIIGGVTALFHYGLIDEVPNQLWLLVPPSIRTTDPKYYLIRTKRDLTQGISKFDSYKITSLERTLIDALVFSSKIGERLAKQAVIRALRRNVTSSSKIFSMAETLNALRIVERHWQSILAGVAE
jgi:predicted transcriptional regulator of viral defense system